MVIGVCAEKVNQLFNEWIREMEFSASIRNVIEVLNDERFRKDCRILGVLECIVPIRG